jgi:hypothetical protein
MGEAAAEREERLRQLASKLFFTLEHKGSRYELYRDADVERPVRHEGLTLDQVEQILNRGNSEGRTAGKALRTILASTGRSLFAWCLGPIRPHATTAALAAFSPRFEATGWACRADNSKHR